MKTKGKLLGYGVFCGVLWGDEKKNWQFEPLIGIHPSKKEADAVSHRTSHCLSREVRPIHEHTMLNTGHHSRPVWIKAKKFLKQ